MDFSSLVLMQKDKETGFVTKELGSFSVDEGALYVRKLFVLDNVVNMQFDTNKDVEDWEFSAIYDNFNEKIFEENGFLIEENAEEFNPTYTLKFEYLEEHFEMEEKISKAIELIRNEFERIFEYIKDKKEEYLEE